MPNKSPEKFRTFEAVFDRFTMNNLFKLSKYFEEETLSPISIGKEANVFSAKSHLEDRDKIIIKIHRLETSDFNNMYYYINSDPRFTGLKKRRREIIFAWTSREFRNLMAAREAQVRCPMPIAFLKNIILMEHVGTGEAAPKLKDKTPAKPKEFLEKTIENIGKYYNKGLVHGDLSKFNILNLKETPVLIDFSQAVPLKSHNSEELLIRDVKNVLDYFNRLGVKKDLQKAVNEIKNYK